MSLSRVKTWSSGEVLTASDLNAEFNNLLNNSIALVSSGTSMTNGQLLIGNTGSLPSVASPTGSDGITITSGAGTLAFANDPLLLELTV